MRPRCPHRRAPAERDSPSPSRPERAAPHPPTPTYPPEGGSSRERRACRRQFPESSPPDQTSTSSTPEGSTDGCESVPPAPLLALLRNGAVRWRPRILGGGDLRARAQEVGEARDHRVHAALRDGGREDAFATL